MKSFEKPTQVCFKFGENIYYGIAYHNEIICADDGYILEIDLPNLQILEEFINWIDFEEIISKKDLN